MRACFPVLDESRGSARLFRQGGEGHAFVAVHGLVSLDQPLLRAPATLIVIDTYADPHLHGLAVYLEGGGHGEADHLGDIVSLFEALAGQ